MKLILEMLKERHDVPGWLELLGLFGILYMVIHVLLKVFG